MESGTRSADGAVLVLGAGGFVGAAIAGALATSGRKVFAYSRSAAIATSPHITPVRGSIEDTALLRDAIAECTTIVHAASLTTPGTSASDPVLEVMGNLLPLARVLECAATFRGRHLVYLSSGGTVYGDFDGHATESAPLRPRSYYGAAKVGAEALIHACATTTDWTASVIRPSNIYGPGQTTGRGFAVVPTLFERALDGQLFQVWGDGQAVRDYCYIDDVVAAVGAVVAHRSDAGCAVYNLASGCRASVMALIAACERASGRSIRTSFAAARDVDVRSVILDANTIATTTGWSARVELAEGLARTWQWMTALRSNDASS